MTALMSGWIVSFACDTSRVAPEVLALARSHLEDMGHALVQIGAESPFWVSLRESGLRIDVAGWRFHFRVDPGAAVLIHVEPVGLC